MAKSDGLPINYQRKIVLCLHPPQAQPQLNMALGISPPSVMT